MANTINHVLWYPGNELLLPDIVRAEGCRVYDSKGNEYLDLESGVWSLPLGHNHPDIARVIFDQASRISHTGFNYSSGVVEKNALAVLSLMEFDGGACVFLCSGGEAVEYGVRSAQWIMNRPLLMTMADSYFGAYGSAVLKDSSKWFCFDWTQCGECGNGAVCDDGCEHWNKIPFKDIGGFLFEPGSSAGLVRFPPAKLIQAIVNKIKENHGLLLVNEVTTGMGRTGMWFGYQHYGISPDIVSLGKGIGNGYPVSVTVFAPNTAGILRRKPLIYAQSHQNDPQGAAVVGEVIRIMRDGKLVEGGLEKGNRLADGLRSVASRSKLIKEVRSRGLMTAVELIDDDSFSLTTALHRELVQRGFLVGRRRNAGVVRIDPSLIIEPADIDRFFVVFEEILLDKK